MPAASTGSPPTSWWSCPRPTHVTLSYGYTPVDWIGFILSLLGVLGVVRAVAPAPGAISRAAPSGRRCRPVDRYEGPRHLATKVRRRMADLDPDILAAVFKAYDIRGIVPDQINTELARAVGAAFAGFAGSERILVARDMRPSGVELTNAFAAGVTAAGVDVVDLGLTSTDELYFASGSLEAAGAMFTASHNPAHYNGIKLCLAGARPVGADTGLREIRAAVAAIGRDGTQLRRCPGR